MNAILVNIFEHYMLKLPFTYGEVERTITKRVNYGSA
jgi:hypothetical protein